jgi:7-carboxy-7-deazaguanine synthase
MSYGVKEIFYTLQGEGVNVGRPAVFLRFAGCNLWSGVESERNLAICQFCDTDFVGTDGTGGGRYASAEDLVRVLDREWPRGASPKARRFVVCTGGEPLLQLDAILINALHSATFEIAIETNGTLPLPGDIDWVCVSPKAGTQLEIKAGNELKLVFPQYGAEPERFEHLSFDHFVLQAMHGPRVEQHTQQAIDYCMTHPQWRLSLQTHKILGLR